MKSLVSELSSYIRLLSSCRRTALKSFIAFSLALVFAACGDDGSDFATKPSGESSSIKSSSSVNSSGSEDKGNRCDIETDKNCMKDRRDGQTYRTVTIGDQVWMAENLNYAYIDIPYSYSNRLGRVIYSDSTSWCYDNIPANCAEYGRLYTWAAAMDSVGVWSTNGKDCGLGTICSPTIPVRGICPEGWHLPSNEEWETLFTAVGGMSVAGTKLKSMSGWSKSGNGTDEFGFKALPAGFRYDDKELFDGKGVELHLWSSTEYEGPTEDEGKFVSGISWTYAYDYAYRNDKREKNSAFSVRCVKD